jgi:bifunctional DNase/RNase
MNDMVEVVIDSVRVSLMSPQRVVILREKDMERYLCIWIGPYEAESITVALQEVEISRPLTHDLLKSLFTVLNGKLLRVEIVALKADIFYGNIVAETDGKNINIDSRPSDAVALAVRAHVPILVSQAVMDEAGIVPEHDMQLEDQQAPADESHSGTPGKNEEGLDVFEDFLKKLKDDQGDQRDEEKPEK